MKQTEEMKEVELLLCILLEDGHKECDIWSFGEMPPEQAEFFCQTMRRRINTGWWKRQTFSFMDIGTRE